MVLRTDATLGGTNALATLDCPTSSVGALVAATHTDLARSAALFGDFVTVATNGRRIETLRGRARGDFTH